MLQSIVSATIAQHLHRLAARLFSAAAQARHSSKLLQHLLHLHELLQHAVYFFDRRSAALRNALAAAAADDVLLAPLLRRHRVDDGLDARDLLLVGFVRRELL